PRSPQPPESASLRQSAPSHSCSSACGARYREPSHPPLCDLKASPKVTPSATSVPPARRPPPGGYREGDGRCCTGFWTPATPRPSACAAGRRPKSVDARSRGKVGAGPGGERYEVRDLGNSKSGGLETRGRVKRFGTIVAK